MTLTLRPLSALGSGKAANGKVGEAKNVAASITASCLVDEECGMRIPSQSDDQRSSGLDLEDEVVTFRRVPDGDESVREVRISCPDATGLGCDIARMLLDFGLRILTGDLSTDGTWCYLVFVVKLTPGLPAHWGLLKQRLEKVCPSPSDVTPWRWTATPADFQHPFLLQVSSYDRVGVLHDLMHTLWEADVTVFKAHITTNPASDVLDMFWIYDNRHELPDHHRVLEISDQVRQVLNQPNSQCTIAPAPADSAEADSAVALAKRCLCKDADPVSPLRSVVSSKRLGGSGTGGSSNNSVSEAEQADDAASDEFGPPEQVEVSVDNITTASYSLVCGDTAVSVVCRDRKGLVYDLMRTMKDIEVRVAYGRIAVRPDGVCEIDVFVQETDGTRIQDEDLLAELNQRVRRAVALPVRIAVKDIYDETCTELLISAPLDSGGRGRPRVTYDVTAALNAIGICVFMADIYVEPPEEMQPGLDRRPQELHRFLVHRSDGCRLATPAEKRAVYERVRMQLMGTTPEPPQQTQRAASMAAADTTQSLIDSLSNWKWSAPA